MTPRPAQYLPGHGIHCKCDGCRRCRTRYSVWLRLQLNAGVDLMVDAAPSQRKIRSLMAIGYTTGMIGEGLGVGYKAVNQFLGRAHLASETAKRIDDFYRTHQMVIPPDTQPTRRARSHARRNGWRPPLAWEDIEAGIVAETEIGLRRDRLDEARVEEFLASPDRQGGWALSPLEKAEVVQRWIASGRSKAALGRLTGWNVTRYRASHPDREQESA